MYGLDAFALYWEMGLGKTKAIIDEFAALRMQRKCNAVIVISDKGSYMNWADNELPKHMPTSIPHIVVPWTGSMTKKWVDAVQQAAQNRKNVLPIYLFNTEAFSGSGGVKAINTVLPCVDKCYMALDEATSIKSPTANRTKNLIKASRSMAVEYRRIMTGTPITQSPLDVYSQYDFLGGSMLGYKNFYLFRARYAVLKTEYAGVRSYQKVVGYQNQAELTARMDRFCSRLTKKDCLDLPEKIYITRYVEMTSEQEKAYDEVKKDLLTQLEAGTVTAPLAITGMSKLRQICMGAVKTDDGDIAYVESNRLGTLHRLLDECSGKAIIWCDYKAGIEQIMDALEPGTAVSYYGETEDDERKEALDSFMKDPKVRWFVGTPSTGGKSLTLTVATTVIYYTLGFNLEQYLQSQDRAHRIGQTQPVTYVHLVCKGRVDEYALERLMAKEDMSRSILDNLKRLV